MKKIVKCIPFIILLAIFIAYGLISEHNEIVGRWNPRIVWGILVLIFVILGAIVVRKKTVQKTDSITARESPEIKNEREETEKEFEKRLDKILAEGE